MRAALCRVLRAEPHELSALTWAFLLLPAALQLLSPAAGARRAGGRGRHRKAAMAVHRHVCRDAGPRAGLRLAVRTPLSRSAPSRGVRLLRAEPAAVQC